MFINFKITSFCIFSFELAATHILDDGEVTFFPCLVHFIFLGEYWLVRSSILLPSIRFVFKLTQFDIAFRLSCTTVRIVSFRSISSSSPMLLICAASVSGTPRMDLHITVVNPGVANSKRSTPTIIDVLVVHRVASV